MDINIAAHLFDGEGVRRSTSVANIPRSIATRPVLPQTKAIFEHAIAELRVGDAAVVPFGHVDRQGEIDAFSKTAEGNVGGYVVS